MDRSPAKRLTGHGPAFGVRRVRFSARQERGTVLFLGLALLLAITAGALSGAQTTLLELRMARNGQDAARAFHAADAALAEAEARLRGGGHGDAVPGARFGETPAWRDPAAWETFARNAQTPLPDVAHAPRVLIERVASWADPETPGAPATDVFRITARAVGSGRSTVALLQSTYAVGPEGDCPTCSGRLGWIELEP